MDYEAIIKNALSDYKQSGSKQNFLNKLKDVDIKNWKFYYLKADAIYSINHNDYKRALVEIKKSIKEYEASKNDLLAGFFGSVYESSYDIKVPVYKIYFLAGELYTRNGEEQNSLKCYHKYQYYSQKKSDFTDKDSVIVYSFRRYNEYTLSDIINKEITVCHPSKMNDPFDTLIFEWNKNLPSICKEPTHIKPYQESFDSYKIRSFVANYETMDTDDSIVSDILMWSHYTDSHKGLCLKYRLSNFFFEKRDDKKYISHRLKKVVYEQNKVSVDLPKIDSELGYVTKSAVWERENEVRLIYYGSSLTEYLGIPLDHDSHIEAVYFGLKMEEANKKTIKNLLRRQKVTFYDMYNTKDDVYNIQPKKIGSDISVKKIK